MEKEILITKIILPVIPIAKGRPRFTKKGFAYTPGKTRNAEKEIKHYLIKQLGTGFKPLQGALRLVLFFYLLKPRSTKNTWPTSRPDLDNYVKLVKDAMNEIVYLDDSQVIWLEAKKLYSNETYIKALIYEINNETAIDIKKFKGDK